MIKMIETLLNLIKEIDTVGSELNGVKSELRERDLELKIKKSELEFSEKYADKREGLKVKEIPNTVLNETIEETQICNQLKAKRDGLEDELYVLKLQFQYTKEVIDSQKQ